MVDQRSADPWLGYSMAFAYWARQFKHDGAGWLCPGCRFEWQRMNGYG